MKKNILYLIIFAFISCKDKTSDSSVKESHCPETTVTCDYEMKDMDTGKKMVLTNQEVPDAPNCVLAPGDTIRLCKRYGEITWHVQGYWKGIAVVDECEEMRSAILISIKKVTCTYKE